MLKIGYHKTNPVDYVKIIFIMVVSFSKGIGNHIHIFLKNIFLHIFFTVGIN